MQVKDLMKLLQDHYKPEDEIAFSLWEVVDILVRNKECHGKKITKAKAKKILRAIQESHDANIGINWEVVDAHLEELP